MVQARVQDALERRLRWLFGIAAAAFGFFSGAVFLAPLGVAGVETPLSGQALRWTGFVVAYGAMAAIVCARVAWRPSSGTFLMLVLAVGAGLSGLASLTGLGRPDAPAGALASGAAIDLAAACVFGLAWTRLWFAAAPGDARAHRDEALLAALLDALVPAGGAVEIGGTDPTVRRAILSRRSAARSETRLRLELRAIDLACRLLVRESFASASTDTRGEVLHRLMGTRVEPLRRIVLAWREAALAAYYADPRVLAEIGFDRAYLERRLVEGPNREEHRARLATLDSARDGARSDRESSGDRALERPAKSVAPALRLVRNGGPTTP